MWSGIRFVILACVLSGTCRATCPCLQGLKGSDRSECDFGSCMCTRHYLENKVRPVLDECVRHVPVYGKRLIHEPVEFTAHLPVLKKKVTNQLEKYLTHLPVLDKVVRPSYEFKIQRVPVLKKRIRPVIEHYVKEVPVLKKCYRPVETCCVRQVPVWSSRLKPVVSHCLERVPVTGRYYKPVLQSFLTRVPVKQTYLRHLEERRIVAKKVPCPTCSYDCSGRSYSDSFSYPSFPSCTGFKQVPSYY